MVLKPTFFMKKYYLHIGTENSGPFDLEELIAQKITKKTAVWFEGLENWHYAGEIEELNRVFAVVPPPIERFSGVSPIKEIKTKAATQVKEDEDEEVKILGLSKNVFFSVLSILILIIATLIFNNYQDSRDRELEKKNHKTEIENRQAELKQKEIEEDKIAAAEQERLEVERANQQKKQSDNNRLLEIKNLISLAQHNKEIAQDKFNNASGFKFFRTAEDKKEQLDDLQNEINTYKSEIEKLKNEAYQIDLELEKAK